MQETLDIVEVYRTLFEEYLAIPTIIGRKSNLERFAGADETFSIETMMRDKKALQAGTSHYLGTNFGTAFDVKFQSKDNKELPVYATSWGVSTRMIGALIMVHGDDNGLKLPPRIAPIQVVIIPINTKKENEQEFLNYIEKISNSLSSNSIRYKVDDGDDSPGFKFNKWELKGVPIRIEVGLKEFENEEITLCRRDSTEKIKMTVNSLDKVQSVLSDIQQNMFNDAKAFMDKNSCTAKSFKEFTNILNSENKFIEAYWDGSDETELLIKEKTKATIRLSLIHI